MNGSAFNWVMYNFMEFRAMGKNHARAITGIQRVLKSQAKINKTSAYFMIATVVYAAITKAQLDAQKMEIKKIEEEVEELKRMKGE